ncbi:hypothetical protein LCGC14_1837770 [marine sediment metagenome]|uniref:thymidylate synthase n=2 Tax=root TaxID=1 RepID=A0A0F9GEB0_9ZZZZ|nr:MAG: bifunctional dihydrofolate reductase-thymidylate synthase [Marseillevirus LCMAC202]
MYKNINLIVACQRQDWGIAMNGELPWKAPTDMRHFKQVTSETKNYNLRNAVVMGRKTYDTIGRPLPNRMNYVVTRNPDLLQITGKDLCYVPSLKEALEQSTANQDIERVFIIGGADMYMQSLTEWRRWIDTTYLTLIDTEYPCDQFLSQKLVEENHNLVSTQEHVEKNGTRVVFQELRARNLGEEEYLNLMRRILQNGTRRSNRTGIDIISLFGERMVFDINTNIPFLTTKRLAWKTMLRELLWFISGDTNNATLQAKNVHIWDKNSTREYLDSIGLYEREEGDLGQVYGFQWRHFGAEYTNCHADYTGKGVDQLQEVIRLIKEDPDSRRIILSAWNPLAQPSMVLPACHLLSQWYVRDGKYLDCQMYQRSGDVALGVPFNIASYSLLTYMLAQVTGLQPGMYTHILGDAHIYVNHIEAVKQQFDRVAYTFPRLRFTRQVPDIDDFKEEDFEVLDYRCHPTIKMVMAV